MERFTACFAERLVLHTAAYWLMLTVRDTIAKPHPLAIAEFTTLQNRRAHHRDCAVRVRPSTARSRSA